ncbi:MAG: GAF domain-containing protein [Anaerolineae bacterium]|nr:GAF domain-containing protein [Anaerolineae bacterium]
MSIPSTCELLEERLATLHSASLELVQDISLPSLLQRIATLAQQQTAACYAVVGVTTTDGKLEHLITAGFSDVQKNHLQISQLTETISEQMLTAESILLNDLHYDLGFLGFPPDANKLTSLLGVPIQKGNQLLGKIFLANRSDERDFTNDDLLVVETLAAYAAAAISNAHLYEQIYKQEQSLVRRTENLALINLLAATLAASNDIDHIVESALSQVMDYLKAQCGEIYLRQEDSKLLKAMIHKSPNGEKLWLKSTYKFGEGIIGKTAQSNQPVIINFSSAVPEANEIIQPYYQTACFPLSSPRSTTGVLSISIQEERPLEELEIQFLTAIAAWIGTVIDNVRLALQQQRLAILEERERIGMDLHDGIIQSIYGVGLSLENVRLMLKDDPTHVPERIDRAIADLNSTIRDIRTYILDLTPRRLNNENLMQGIQRLANEFYVNTLVDINLVGSMEEVEELPEAQAVALFHICQEALANIAKHARARKASVSVWTSADRALMEVSDDGRGFDPLKVTSALGHGLPNMQTRAHNIGGDIEITSEPGNGTTLLVWVPFTREQKNHA